MISDTKRVIYIATREELSCHCYYLRLWMAVKNINISRRLWLDELADTFRDFPGHVLQRNGHPFIIPCLDDVFGNDPDLRWLGYYLREDKTGIHPNSISRKMERLRLLDLYFRIKHPLIARHFGK
ncbi:hypothetical protein [Agarilytica rhodophyticola]|uniref:hypothetical protein n=1 Tax=Agarilytica rhodophyticola TaxID=1737490 RepID=UPI001315584D|nr:hypothetical protein [Agarilytica rhodophyticola]